MQKPSFATLLFVLMLLGELTMNPASAQQAGATAAVSGSSRTSTSSAPASPAARAAAEQARSIASDKVVLRVGDERVTAGELYELMGTSPEVP
jgi:hypothetical protein